MDFTTTLADSLLDDLDDLSDSEEKEVEAEDDNAKGENGGEDSTNERGGSSSSNNDGDKSSSTHQTKKGQRFADDPKLQAHLAFIESSSAPMVITNQEEAYSSMTTSNKYLMSIESAITKAHTDLTIAYNTKFPELEDLLPNPISYKNAIKVIQNEMDLTLINDELNSVAKLSSNQIITLSVASSTTAGEPLSTEQLEYVNECISHIDKVLDIKERLIHHVTQLMESLAPNTCVLIGPTLAARMVSTAGGISELSRIPACNLQVLGQHKATSASRAGMSTNIAAAASASVASGGNVAYKPHEGILSESDLYRAVPSHLQRKALKVIAAKLALALRCDYVNLESGRAKTKTSGLKFRTEIEEKFVKWEEPDKAQVVKALPNLLLITLKLDMYFSFGTSIDTIIDSLIFSLSCIT